MNHSASDQSLYIESDEGEDERKNMSEEEHDGSLSDSSDAYNRNRHQSKPSSYSTAWPKSYRYIIYYHHHSQILNILIYILTSVLMF